MAKKYYWIKLKTDFFNSDEMDFLLTQENGCEYIVLYQMLCLNTANNNGELASRIGEMIIPYNVNKIVRDTKYFGFDTVTVALGLFKQLGLIYEEEGKVLKISNYESMVGSNTEWAEKKRKYREKQKQLGQGVGQIEGQKEDIVLKKEDIVRQEIEIDIEIEKDIEIDKEINKEKEKEKESKNTPKQELEKNYFENEELNNLFIDFLEIRKKLKAVNSDRAINSLLKTLSQYDDDTKIQMIENSITNSWKGVFPLKQNNFTKQPVRQEIVPEWLNKETKNEELTEEEQNEIEDMLSSITPEFEKRKEALQERLRNKYGKNVSNREQI